MRTLDRVPPTSLREPPTCRVSLCLAATGGDRAWYAANITRPASLRSHEFHGSGCYPDGSSREEVLLRPKKDNFGACGSVDCKQDVRTGTRSFLPRGENTVNRLRSLQDERSRSTSNACWRSATKGSLLLLTTLVILGSSIPALAIIGGQDAAPDEFPWVVSIQRRGPQGQWYHAGGGVILNDHTILTAAHQVDGALTSNLRIVAGTSDRSDLTNATISYVTGYTMHQEYGNGIATYANDIALIDVDSALLAFCRICPRCCWAILPSNNFDSYVGRTAEIVGWGRTSGSSILPNNLQKAPIEVISVSEANVLLASVSGARVWDQQLPAYDRSNIVTACNGDGGGPLVVYEGGAPIVAGIISWGISSSGNCSASYPMVTTRVSSYLDWIANTMNKKSQLAPEDDESDRPVVNTLDVRLGPTRVKKHEKHEALRP